MSDDKETASTDTKKQHTVSQSLSLEVPQDDSEPYRPSTNSYHRLLLPNERGLSEATVKKPRHASKTHKVYSKETKRWIHFAESTIKSLSANDSRLKLNTLEDEVFHLHPESELSLLETAYECNFFMSHPCKVKRLESDQSHTDNHYVKLTEENLFRMLADEIPVPSLESDSEEAEDVYAQLDKYIVDTLPKEFWGSQFYRESEVYIDQEESPDPEQKKKAVKVGSSLIDELAEIINQKDIHVLSHYNSRFSRKRTHRFLNSIQEDTLYVVDPIIVDAARKRLDTIMNDLYTKPQHRYRSVVHYIGSHKLSKMQILLLLELFLISFASDVTNGDHLHVSLQFLHQDMRTKWIPFPANQLPHFMQQSSSSLPLSLLEMKLDTLKPLKVCFEFTDMNRQTSWITIYDGRGVFAENVNLLILVRDKNIVWVDVEVEYYNTIFHTGDSLPETINVNFKWNIEYSFNGDRGYSTVLWLSMLITPLLVLGIVYISFKQYDDEIKMQQFKQPVKSQKADYHCLFNN